MKHLAVFSTADCVVPLPPLNGSILQLTGTDPGDIVTFACDNFFLPSTEVTAVCTEERLWDPPPEDYICTLDGTRECWLCHF